MSCTSLRASKHFRDFVIQRRQFQSVPQAAAFAEPDGIRCCVAALAVELISFSSSWQVARLMIDIVRTVL